MLYGPDTASSRSGSILTIRAGRYIFFEREVFLPFGQNATFSWMGSLLLFGPDTTFITMYNVLKIGPDTIFIGKVSVLAIRVGLFGPEVRMFASWPLVFRQRPWASGLRAGFY